MGSLTLSLGSLAVILVLIALRLPIGVAMGVVAFGGFWYLRNADVALSASSATRRSRLRRAGTFRRFRCFC